MYELKSRNHKVENLKFDYIKIRTFAQQTTQ